MRAPASAVLILSLFLAASCGPKSVRVELLSEAKAPDGSYITWKEHLIDGEETAFFPEAGRDRIDKFLINLETVHKYERAQPS